MSQNKNFYVGIIFINFIILFGILLFYFNSSDRIIILPGNEVYTLKKGNFKKSNKDIKKVDAIYINNMNERFNYQISLKKDKINFSSNNKNIDLNDNYSLIYSKNLDIKLNDFKMIGFDGDEYKIINNIFKEHNIIGHESANIFQKVEFDFDKDGENEIIYFVTNLFDESIYDKVFSFVYYQKNGEIKYLIDEVTDTDNAYDLCVPYINSIFTLKNNYKMILTCEYFDNIGVENYIYSYNDKEFVREV